MDQSVALLTPESRVINSTTFMLLLMSLLAEIGSASYILCPVALRSIL